MNTYIENNFELKDTDKVTVTLLLYRELKEFTVGKSWKDKFTFLLNGKDYFGNGCQYNCANDCIDFIKSNFKDQIRDNYVPYLCVNGVEIEVFKDVSKFLS